ncbi:MAG: CPBP family intramembrane metalloprotease [Elusimicrobia bacterium]|nr:CPBP family intramembrane metalloprotease [Elusimicrobiota bacterium]
MPSIVKLFLLSAAVLLPLRAAAAQNDIPDWQFFLPGGGQFHLGETAKGLAYAGGVAGLSGWAVAASYKHEPGAVNAPLVYAQQLYVISLYDTYRGLQLQTGAAAYNKRFDKATVGELMSAPFRTEQLTNPWVIGCAAAGAGINYALARARPGRRSFGEMKGMRYLGGSYNRDTGAAVYSAYWLPMSLGAGVSEEMLFRGMIQANFEDMWGERKGLVSASLLFGAAHMSDPGDSDAWANVAFASVAGLFFGWRYQKNGYRLAEEIAGHFWFDVMAGAAVYLADPEENPLGAKVNFAF